MNKVEESGAKDCVGLWKQNREIRKTDNLYEIRPVMWHCDCDRPDKSRTVKVGVLLNHAVYGGLAAAYRRLL